MKRSTVITLSIAVPAVIIVGLFVGRTISGRTQKSGTSPATSVASPSVDSTPADDAQTVEIGDFTELATGPVANTPAADETVAELEVGIHLDVLGFVEDFGIAHTEGDLEYLQASLHPDVPSAFGEDKCARYVEATMGSINTMWVNKVHAPTTYTLATPDGELVFSEAIPVSADWTITETGEIQTIDFHVIPAGDSAMWLSTCGWSAQG
ncbi:MAG: hypothetical protein GY925_08055 [Actinomycetia bacterium]|nr:hypothetical protein [Actinomycetes bacterium]